MSDNLESIQTAFMSIVRHADKLSSDILHDTFVDTEPLMAVLNTTNNQILYGRRGTGKTHALLYLSEQVRTNGDFPIYLDLRSIGSDGSIYNDPERSVSERSVRLVLDVLKFIGMELFRLVVEKIPDHPHPKDLTQRLDLMESSFNEIRISGETTISKQTTNERAASSAVNLKLTLNHSPELSSQYNRNLQQATESSRSETGRERFTLHFGHVQGALRDLLDILGRPRIWVLADEWSEIPVELQPYLADLFRRTFMPIENFVIKIAAIEHRSMFYAPRESGSYIGFELGADISTDLNLDDFLVFDNDEKKSLDFF